MPTHVESTGDRVITELDIDALQGLWTEDALLGHSDPNAIGDV